MSKAKLMAVVLAAGASTRLGQSKQLIKYRGETLLNRALRTGQWLTQRPALAILGHDAENISNTLPKSASYHLCSSWEQGQAHSIASAFEVLDEDVDSVLIMTVDQWAITRMEWLSMLGIWQQESHEPIAAAYADTLGIPAIFPRSYFERLSTLSGDVGAKSLLMNQAETIMVYMPNAAKDLDTPDDLAELEALNAADDDDQVL